VYGGQYAKENRGILDIKNPTQNGMIIDWDAMEDIWYHMYFEELMVPPENYPILHSEPVNNPISSQEKLIEVNFCLINIKVYFFIYILTK